ncbi:MAG: DNA-directed RNA polymerase specialized sigma24 family protein [Gammaproteobacteria bacterium]|jgi:DNA-directed RNA polymerase specialized sigma24 family protein
MTPNVDIKLADDGQDLARISRYLQGFIRRRLGHKQAHSADDLAQESFLLALGRDVGQAKVAPDQMAFARLKRIAELRILSHARASERETTGVEPSHDGEVPSGDTPRANGLQLTASAGLSRLRPDQHWALLLRDVLGTQWETMAVVLEHDSLNSVRCLHQRARRSLRCLLDPDPTP